MIENFNDLLALAAGVGLRIGLPLLATVLLAHLLRQMDARWLNEARSLRPHSLGAQAYQIRCWEQTDCPPEKRQACPAYHSDRPCWQVMRQVTGRLPQACLSCQVFRDATPAIA